MHYFQDGVQDGRRYIKMAISQYFFVVEVKFRCLHRGFKGQGIH